MNYIHSVASKSIVQALFITIVVMVICSIGFPSFFHVDDANNSYLPNLMQQGLSWLQGDIPFIINKTMIGDNMLVDIDRAIFLPTNIAVSIFAALVKNMTLTSYFLVFINLTIISYASLWAARQLSSDALISFVAAASIAINPIVIYVYAASWYNGLSGHAWFLMSVASTIFFIKENSVKSLLINCLSVVFLFLSGWPHAIIAYAVFLIVYVGFMPGYSLKKKFIYALALFGCVCIIIPAFSEYIVNGVFLDRPGGVNNAGNFLSPGWDQILMGLNPFYYGFIHTFGGYRYLPIAIGYIGIIPGIIIANALINKKVPVTAYPFLILAVVFVILTQLPQQLGPTRWQFRYLPFFSYFLIFAACIIGSHKDWSISTRSKYISIAVILITALLSWLKGDMMHGHAFVLLLAITVLTLVIMTHWKLWRNNFFVVLVALILPVTIFKYSCKTLADGYVASNTLNNEIADPQIKGRILVATGGHGLTDRFENATSANLQWYNINAFNGYSPVGNKAIIDVFRYYSAHAVFDTGMLVNNLENDFNGRYQCLLNKLDIRLLVLSKNDDRSLLNEKMNSCGYVRQEVDDFVYYKNDNLSGVGVNTEDNSEISVVTRSNNADKYIVKDNGKYYFSRVNWKGYSAWLDGHEVEVKTYAGFIPYVEVSNIAKPSLLEIKYYPSTWKYTLFISIFGLFVIICTAFFINRINNKRNIITNSTI